MRGPVLWRRPVLQRRLSRLDRFGRTAVPAGMPNAPHEKRAAERPSPLLSITPNQASRIMSRLSETLFDAIDPTGLKSALPATDRTAAERMRRFRRRRKRRDTVTVRQRPKRDTVTVRQGRTTPSAVTPEAANLVTHRRG